MFGTFSRSWELAKASLSVLRSDKELILFPFISFIALVIVTLSFAVPWLFLGGLTGLLGFAWNVATYLVVPVLVVEKVGPIDAVKRSGSLLRKTWGEQLVGNFGIGLVFGLLTFVVIVIGVGLVVLVAQSSVALTVAVALAVVLVVGLIALIGAAASGIFTASLYRYATTGEGGSAFRTETLAAAFRQKNAAAPGYGRPF